MYDDHFPPFIVVLVLLLGAFFFIIFTMPEEAEPGLTQEWKCSDDMTMIVDIPGDALGPVEGYHCERVAKGGKD